MDCFGRAAFPPSPPRAIPARCPARTAGRLVRHSARARAGCRTRPCRHLCALLRHPTAARASGRLFATGAKQHGLAAGRGCAERRRAGLPAIGALVCRPGRTAAPIRGKRAAPRNRLAANRTVCHCAAAGRMAAAVQFQHTAGV